MEPRAYNSVGYLLICQLHFLPVHHTTNPLGLPGTQTLSDPQTQDWKMKPEEVKQPQEVGGGL